MTDNIATVNYFHPRDFDPDQPMLDGPSLKRKFKPYYNLSKAYPKFKKLIQDFNFVDIREGQNHKLGKQANCTYRSSRKLLINTFLK